MARTPKIGPAYRAISSRPQMLTRCHQEGSRSTTQGIHVARLRNQPSRARCGANPHECVMSTMPGANDVSRTPNSANLARGAPPKFGRRRRNCWRSLTTRTNRISGIPISGALDNPGFPRIDAEFRPSRSRKAALRLPKSHYRKALVHRLQNWQRPHLRRTANPPLALLPRSTESSPSHPSVHGALPSTIRYSVSNHRRCRA